MDVDTSHPNIEVYGHVYDRLKEYKDDDETFAKAIERLLPWNGEVIEFSASDTKRVATTEDVHRELKDCSGQRVSVSDVLDQYLREAGYERDEDSIRRN